MLELDFPQMVDTLTSDKGLDTNQVQQCFEKLIQGKLDDIKIAALLTGLKAKGITGSDLLGAASAMRDNMLPFPKLNDDEILVDCVGTGGDGFNTYNISSLASLSLATYGLKTAKHGNRKVSSQCGAGDILSHIGVNIHLNPFDARYVLDKTNFCFLMAPDYHPGAKHAKTVRQQLQTKTIFNLLGPLVNPARPSHMLVGVYAPEYTKTMINVLKVFGVKRAMVVHGTGLDEIAIHGPTTGYELNGDIIKSITITPEACGLDLYPLESIMSQSIEDSQNSFIDCIKGNGSKALKSAVSINAGSLLYLTGKCQTIKDGTHEILKLLETDKVYQHLQLIKEVSRHA